MLPQGQSEPIAFLSCCLHNGAPTTTEAMAPAPSPVAPPPHCLCMHGQWGIKYNARMSSLQRKRGSEEEGICQNSLNTYTDRVWMPALSTRRTFQRLAERRGGRGWEQARLLYGPRVYSEASQAAMIHCSGGEGQGRKVMKKYESREAEWKKRLERKLNPCSLGRIYSETKYSPGMDALTVYT